MILGENLHLGLVSWLEIENSANIMLVGNAALYENYFTSCGNNVCCAMSGTVYMEVFQQYHKESFDYIIGIDVLETESNPKELLEAMRGLLKSKGKIFLGTDNRLGLRYLCGEQDPFTKRCFDGLDNYSTYLAKDNCQKLGGRCFTKAEIKEMLKEAGLKMKFYSVLPTLENPQWIIAEDYISPERISARYRPLYRNPDTILFKEEQICEDFFQNGAFHAVANAFWIECTLDSSFLDIKQVTLSLDRGKEYAYSTIIHSENVKKKPVYVEGEVNLRRLALNMQNLQEKGIDTVSGKLIEDSYIMPYVKADLGNVYLQRLLRTDADEFLEKMDYFYKLILSSSEHTTDNEYGIILKDGYIDMVPLNSFYMDDKFVFFDQEFCIPNYPAKAILYRAIIIIYEQVPMDASLIPIEKLWERYGLVDNLDYWCQITTEFVNDLRNYKKLVTYYDKHMRNEWITGYNRNKLDSMVNKVDFYEEYRRNSCFEDLNDKKVFLFGAGKWCDKFVAFYKNDYNICRILDNDESKWGKTLRGIPIDSPESLVGEQAAYKVIICAKNYEPIFRQLKRMQVIHIGIYDANYIYPGRQMLSIFPVDGVQKKYRIGYLSGTFDLFHIGHINMFKRAKEQCEYLIAAVTSDEYVRTRKNKEPVIPFEERVEVLRSCKYVDEVVGVPFEYAGTVEAFQKYHFDCQFVGSDCENDPWWQEQKEYLQRHGSDLVFFPYTEQTSSTKIKALIEQKLL